MTATDGEIAAPSAGPNAAVAVLLAWPSRAAARPGELFALFLLVHEGGKCVLETLRGPAPIPGDADDVATRRDSPGCGIDARGPPA